MRLGKLMVVKMLGVMKTLSKLELSRELKMLESS
jgi:hypothetical protein